MMSHVCSYPNRHGMRFRPVIALSGIAFAAFAHAAAAQCPDGSLAPCAGPRRAPPANSVAVLAFRNISPDSQQQYVADGIADAVVNALARLPDVKVIARTSSFAFRGRDTDVRVIAESLGVARLVEGTLMQSGTRIRVRARLIEAASGVVLWSDVVDRDRSDVFDLQDEVARNIADRLTTRRAGPLITKTTRSVEAQEHFFRGQQLLYLRSPAAMASATRHFDSALRADGRFAPAHVGRASARFLSLILYFAPPDSAYAWAAQALAAAERAISLDSTNAEAYATRAFIGFFLGAPALGVESDFRRAIRLKPAYPEAHGWLAQFLALHGRQLEAREAISRALELDPLAVGMKLAAVSTAFLGRDWESLIAATRSIQVADAGGGYTRLAEGVALAHLGRASECVERGIGIEALCLHAAGRVEEARTSADALAKRLPGARTSSFGALYDLAAYYGWTGNADQAVAIAREAFSRSPLGLSWGDKSYFGGIAGERSAFVQQAVDEARRDAWSRVVRESQRISARTQIGR